VDGEGWMVSWSRNSWVPVPLLTMVIRAIAFLITYVLPTKFQVVRT